MATKSHQERLKEEKLLRNSNPKADSLFTKYEVMHPFHL